MDQWSMYHQNLGPIHRHYTHHAHISPYPLNGIKSNSTASSRMFPSSNYSAGCSMMCSCSSHVPYVNEQYSHRHMSDLNGSNMKVYLDQSSSVSANSSPLSNPSTPNQNEFNPEFGVPYQLGQPSSVNSITDALCPGGEPSVDRQLTPTSPYSNFPRTVQIGHSVSQTRATNEQNIDDMTAFLQDPIHVYLNDDFTSTLHEDIDVLADTYLGGRNGTASSNMDSNIDYNIILNFLYSDDLISSVMCED